jgi:hypothetical protein
MTETTLAGHDGTEIIHISEADFRRLPRSVRMLILAYSTPEACTQNGLMILKMRRYRWPEIDSEMKTAGSRLRSMGVLPKLKKTIRYLNDYECPAEGAAWSRSGCASARKEHCPICHRKVKPIANERYVVLEYKQVVPNLFSKIKHRIHRSRQ